MLQPAQPASVHPMNDFLTSRIETLVGDITSLDVDAIVNAANEGLRGGGGVDGAIHRAAGRGLLEECEAIGFCPTGEARITSGHRLTARHVIHTVGPVWSGGKRDEPAALRSCYWSSLELAAEHEVRSIAFPCISTGVYRFPREMASDIAISTTMEWLGTSEIPERVIFCCFGDEDYQLYQVRLGALRGDHQSG